LHSCTFAVIQSSVFTANNDVEFPQPAKDYI